MKNNVYIAFFGAVYHQKLLTQQWKEVNARSDSFNTSWIELPNKFRRILLYCQFG